MGKKILLADDSVTIQKVVELTLDEDFELVAVSRGDDALDQLESVNPDLVIADIHMPGANGYEVCRAVKEYRSDLPVLLLVGTFEPFDENEAKSVGADRHLKKPFDSQQLLSIAHDLLAAAAKGSEPEPEMTPEVEATKEPSAASHTEPLPMIEEVVNTDLEAFLAEPVESPPKESIGFGQEDVATPVFGAESGVIPDIVPKAEVAEVETPRFDDDSPLMVDGVELEPADEAEVMAEVDEILGEGLGEGMPEEADPVSVISDPIEIASEPESFEVIHEREEVEEELALAESQDSEPLVEPEPMEERLEVAVPGRISDADVDRIAQRVVELISKAAIQEICWEVVPDLAEVVIKERIQELESQMES